MTEIRNVLTPLGESSPGVPTEAREPIGEVIVKVYSLTPGDTQVQARLPSDAAADIDAFRAIASAALNQSLVLFAQD